MNNRALLAARGREGYNAHTYPKHDFVSCAMWGNIRMRKIAFASLACAVIALSPAAAQQASRTTDDYVCAFAGECDNQDQADDAAATPRAPGSPRSSTTRGFGLSRPSGTSSAGAARKAGAPAQRAVASVNRPRVPAAAAGQRADLRLAFELGSSTLTPTARAEAKVFADSLMRPELKGMKFVIEGHTDSIGGRDYNIDLSRRRAQAVADYLVSLGVTRDRLDIRGYGYDKPLPGLSAGNQQNRRVEAVRIS
jgi:OmpA-OmpF porin, OOP family